MLPIEIWFSSALKLDDDVMKGGSFIGKSGGGDNPIKKKDIEKIYMSFVKLVRSLT